MRAVNIIRDLQPNITKLFVGILVPVRWEQACRDIVPYAHIENGRLPAVRTLLFLPANLIVDTLLRMQVRGSMLPPIVRIHLRKRRHDE